MDLIVTEALNLLQLDRLKYTNLNSITWILTSVLIVVMMVARAGDAANE